jgi:integrase
LRSGAVAGRKPAARRAATDWESIMETNTASKHREPWNKGKLVGQKVPFKPKEIWSIRTRLQMEHRLRELALFDLGLDSKLRGCDLVKLRVRDICHGDRVATRAMVLQQKTQRPVQFEITPAAREAVEAWIRTAGLKPDGFLFSSRVHKSAHLGTRQYARILDTWVEKVGLDPAGYGTHSMRRYAEFRTIPRTERLSARLARIGGSRSA